VQHAIGKLSTKATNFLKPHFNWRFTHKIMGLQSHESPNFGNLGFRVGITLESPETNDIWVLAPWPNTKNIIKGKVLTSPKFEPW